MKHLPLCCLAILALGLAGCGSDSTVPELGTVSGNLTLDGAPVADALIQFYPSEGGRASYGTSDAEGKFTLAYNADSLGAKTGKHTVTITTGQGEELEPGVPGYKPEVEEVIPRKYRENSELTVDVKAGENEIDLPLTK